MKEAGERTRLRIKEDGTLDLAAAGYAGTRKVETDKSRLMAEFDLHVRTLAMIDRTIDDLRRLAELGGETEHDEAHLIALWTGALIQYGRCFDPTSRHALPAEKIFNFSSGMLEQHQEFCTIRSKHLAHDVNNMRILDVGVVVEPNGELGQLVRPFAVRIPSVA